MVYRCVGALLAAAVLLAAQSAVQAQVGAHRVVIVPNYGYMGPYGSPYQAPTYGWYYYNPYVAPYPAYGILPPPFATLRMAGGDFDGARFDAQRTRAPERSAEELVADVTRFRFEITVPTPDAVVLVGGAKTKQQGLHRVYTTPPLIVDKHYTYSVEVQWTDDAGSKRTEKTSFDFLLGEPTRHLYFPLKMTK
jgi:uncharacterized protein (TIGR03000 family)